MIDNSDYNSENDEIGGNDEINENYRNVRNGDKDK